MNNRHQKEVNYEVVAFRYTQIWFKKDRKNELSHFSPPFPFYIKCVNPFSKSYEEWGLDGQEVEATLLAKTRLLLFWNKNAFCY